MSYNSTAPPPRHQPRPRRMNRGPNPMTAQPMIGQLAHRAQTMSTPLMAQPMHRPMMGQPTVLPTSQPNYRFILPHGQTPQLLQMAGVHPQYAAGTTYPQQPQFTPALPPLGHGGAQQPINLMAPQNQLQGQTQPIRPAGRPHVKRESKAIKIIDPSTNQEVNLTDSSKATSVPPQPTPPSVATAPPPSVPQAFVPSEHPPPFVPSSATGGPPGRGDIRQEFMNVVHARAQVASASPIPLFTPPPLHPPHQPSPPHLPLPIPSSVPVPPNAIITKPNDIPQVISDHLQMTSVKDTTNGVGGSIPPSIGPPVVPPILLTTGQVDQPPIFPPIGPSVAPPPISAPLLDTTAPGADQTDQAVILPTASVVGNGNGVSEKMEEAKMPADEKKPDSLPQAVEKEEEEEEVEVEVEGSVETEKSSSDTPIVKPDTTETVTEVQIGGDDNPAAVDVEVQSPPSPSSGEVQGTLPEQLSGEQPEPSSQQPSEETERTHLEPASATETTVEEEKVTSGEGEKTKEEEEEKEKEEEEKKESAPPEVSAEPQAAAQNTDPEEDHSSSRSDTASVVQDKQTATTPPPSEVQDIAPPVQDSVPPVQDSAPPVQDSAPHVQDSVPPGAPHVQDSVPPVQDSVPPVQDKRIAPHSQDGRAPQDKQSPKPQETAKEPVKAVPKPAVDRPEHPQKAKPHSHPPSKKADARKSHAESEAAAPARQMYDRDFLLSFREKDQCKEPPEELKANECFKSMDASSSMPPAYGGYTERSNRKNRGGKNEPKRIIQPPVREKVELHKAEVAWTPKPTMGVDLSEEEQATQELYRKFQGILNKLTPQKFQSLAEQALKLDISTEERLKGVIDKIFTKALEEPSFSIAYANLCKVLSPLKVECVAEDGSSRTTNFRRVLLTKCQQEFEKDKKDDEEREEMLQKIEAAESEEAKKQMQAELDVLQTKARRRSLGNIRFIGELFKLKMLSETIMHECIIRLLRSASDEESLECFGRLITTTGKDLDQDKAKVRIDGYFNRIADIIKKGKIPSRIKFMLQDVQELRRNNWVPRTRQENTLKTIDQIHAEARAEEEMTKQIAAHHQALSGGGGYKGRGDDKRGRRDGKPGGDKEWTTVGDRDAKKKSQDKVDTSRIRKLLEKKNQSKEPTLGPVTSFRPGGGAAWKQPPAADSGKGEREREFSKHGKPSRSSSGGSKRSEKDRERERDRDRERDKLLPGRGSGGGAKRAQSNPEKEREKMLQSLKLFQSEPTTAAPKLPSPASQPVLDYDAIGRKASTILDELVGNSDYKEALECLREMRAPGTLHVFVQSSVNYSLEHSSSSRQCLGQLLHRSIDQKLLSEEHLVQGLNEVLEFAEDMEIDIPKIWDYLGEILATTVSPPGVVSLRILSKVPPALVESTKASLLVAKTLQQVEAIRTKSVAASVWEEAGLQWASFGVSSENLEEFLSRQKLEYLHSPVASSSSSLSPPRPSSYLKDLTQLFAASDKTNDNIFEWVEKECLPEEVKSTNFIRTLTTAVVQATVTGSGTSAIFADEQFNTRSIVLNRYVQPSSEALSEDDLQLEVLYALQIAVAKLEHPPKLLHQMFDIVYDVDLVGEKAFLKWKDQGVEQFGKGNAVSSVQGFFEWLESAETESDEAGAT